MYDKHESEKEEDNDDDNIYMSVVLIVKNPAE